MNRTVRLVILLCFVVCSVVSQSVVYDYVQGKEDNEDSEENEDFSDIVDLLPDHAGTNYESRESAQNSLVLQNQAHQLTPYRPPLYRNDYRQRYQRTGRSASYGRGRRPRFYRLEGGREGDPYSRGYHQQQVQVRNVPVPKRVYVPVPVVPKQKKKKIISVSKGFHIEGGIQVFGKFKKLEQCMKLCAAVPTCFAADYNPWLYKCYMHEAGSACGTMFAHKKFIHFKKVPCDVPETLNSQLNLGVSIPGGLEQKGVKSIQDCIKRCANAGAGIAPTITALNQGHAQTCFGIDYDFARHKCYFHLDRMRCPAMVGDAIPIPPNQQQAPGVVSIILCPTDA